MDKGYEVGAIHTDFGMAFDSVDHSVLWHLNMNQLILTNIYSSCLNKYMLSKLVFICFANFLNINYN